MDLEISLSNLVPFRGMRKFKQRNRDISNPENFFSNNSSIRKKYGIFQENLETLREYNLLIVSGAIGLGAWLALGYALRQF